MTPPRSSLPSIRDRMRLGATSLEVGPLCVGMVRDPETIVKAYDAGVNAFFVSCDLHWPYYEGTRRGLERILARGASVRDDIVVFGCSYVANRDFALRPYEELLEFVPRLKRIDVLVAGGAYANDAEGRAEHLRRQCARGFVDARAVGVSFHDRIAASALIDSDLLDVLFVRYNALHPGALFDFFPKVPARRKNAVFNFKSTNGYVSEAEAEAAGVAEDVWLPTRADHYRFVLSRPEVDGILCGPQTPEELEDTIRTLQEGPVSVEDENHFVALAETAKPPR